MPTGVRPDIPGVVVNQVTCAFCHRILPLSVRVVAGPKLYICDSCVVNGWAQMLRPAVETSLAVEVLAYCSFCGKERMAVACLASNGATCICNECVELCSGILLERLGHQRFINFPAWT